MQNVVINMSEKFHNDWLRNDRSLGNRKFDNNNLMNNNVGSAWGSVFGSNKVMIKDSASHMRLCIPLCEN